MHARVVDLTVRSVDTKEMVRVYREEVVPAAREQEGFKGAMLLTDPQTGIGISVTLWETEMPSGRRRWTAASTTRR